MRGSSNHSAQIYWDVFSQLNLTIWEIIFTLKNPNFILKHSIESEAISKGESLDHVLWHMMALQGRQDKWLSGISGLYIRGVPLLQKAGDSPYIRRPGWPQVYHNTYDKQKYDWNNYQRTEEMNTEGLKSGQKNLAPYWRKIGTIKDFRAE